jgi:pimeloyl-ACP methyl ester carboxylesterase
MHYRKAFKSEEGRAAVLKVYDSLLEKWPVAYETVYVSTKYGQTHIIASGEKSLPPLILLHGTSSNSAMWLGDILRYSEYYRVYAIDIPGEPGKSEKRQYSCNSPAYREYSKLF